MHRADDRLEAVSGICTHQGCKLWLDAPEQRLRCPCHSTSFSLEGTNVTHELPIAPAPLPKFQVRETDGISRFLPPANPYETTPYETTKGARIAGALGRDCRSVVHGGVDLRHSHCREKLIEPG